MAEKEKQKKWHNHQMGRHHSGGAIYVLGILGAAIYYLGHATTFGAVILGILKAIVWPAFLVFRLHEFLKL